MRDPLRVPAIFAMFEVSNLRIKFNQNNTAMTVHRRCRHMDSALQTVVSPFSPHLCTYSKLL